MVQMIIDEEIIAPCDTRHLASIRAMVKDAAGRCFSEPMMAGKITLAVDEAVANVMEHAYEGVEPGDVRVSVNSDGQRFIVVVSDQGHHFDPATIKDPDITQHVKQGKRNGLGIFLIRQIMDEINYSFVQSKAHNELRMVKYISENTQGE